MRNRLCKVSLFSIMLVCAINVPAHARVSIRNHASETNIRNQMIAGPQQVMADADYAIAPTSATQTLPVAVDDPKLEQEIVNNTSSSVNTADLENCSMIYPNGLFKWGIPESGVRQVQIPQCIAVVELRDANTNAVLAQTTLAAGDTMKCNIDMFPKSGWQSALEKIELPADEAPTVKDVEKVMNQEQKQHAGLKIAAGAILTGLAGNMLAPKEAGDSRLLGTSKTQLVDTALAATAGAGVAAASVYSGKVAGDTIKSTAVNAATGAVVGNMAAGMAGGGESTLSIKKCTIKDKEYDCIAGKIDKISLDTSDQIFNYTANDGNEVYLVKRSGGAIKKCEKCGTDGQEKDCSRDGKLEYGGVFYQCNDFSSNLLKIQLSKTFAWDDIGKGKDQVDYGDIVIYNLNDNNFRKDPNTERNIGRVSSETGYFLVYSASFPSEQTRHGYAVFKQGLPKKVFGYKLSDWEEIKTKHKITYHSRNYNGSVGNEEEIGVIADGDNKGQPKEEIIFTPLSVDAESDTLVDFSNAGRMKSTLTGAAAGGALGGFSGYQGAKQEVQERWVAATREYNDSLNNFYCATGTRYLAAYNSYAEIPLAKKTQ